MGAVAASDSTADLYRQHHGWLHDWLRRKLGCSHSAADFAHDTFCRLLALPDTTQLRETGAYLVTSATRLMIDRARRDKIERAYLHACAALQSDSYASFPEQHREAMEALMAIAALLEEMPEKVRRAFLLSRLEDMPQAEIAAQLGVSVSMVKQYLARAMVHCYSVMHGAPAAD